MPQQTDLNERDPTLDLKENAEKARSELDSFIGAEESVSGTFNKKLGENNKGENGKQSSLNSSNADYKPTIEHIAKASSITGTGSFNIQNKIYILFGTILALAMLVPITTYIMIFDIKQIVVGFSDLYNNFTFTTILVVAFISFLIVGLTEFLFLGQFNKKNKETRKLEKTILYFLLFIQFGSHSYFAYLITGQKNEEKRETVMTSNSSSEGILTKGLSDSTSSITLQIANLQKDYDKLTIRGEKEEKGRDKYKKEWDELNRKNGLSRAEKAKSRKLYTQQNKAQEEMDKIDKKKEKKLDKINALSDKKLTVSSKLSDISVGLDKELDESGFWRIIYTILLILLFEGLAHINWLAYYRIIKNAPDDLQEDYRQMSFVLNWGSMFANKTKEAIAVMAGQQIRMADEQLNNVKMTSKAFEYQNGASGALMIEATKANVASLGASTNAMQQTTRATLYLAKTIATGGLVSLDDMKSLKYEKNDNIPTVETSIAPKGLIDALEYVSAEFGVSAPSLSLSSSTKSGEFDVLENRITIGENEPDKLSVLAHEFTHFLGYMTHSKEFKQMELSVFKGLEKWYKNNSKA